MVSDAKEEERGTYIVIVGVVCHVYLNYSYIWWECLKSFFFFFYYNS